MRNIFVACFETMTPRADHRMSANPESPTSDRHVTLEILVEQVEPEEYFSYRWHPFQSKRLTSHVG